MAIKLLYKRTVLCHEGQMYVYIHSTCTCITRYVHDFLHPGCYGIVTPPTGLWFCRKCESQERAARVVSSKNSIFHSTCTYMYASKMLLDKVHVSVTRDSLIFGSQQFVNDLLLQIAIFMCMQTF